NAYLPREAGAPCTVSYCMNLLQGLDAPAPFVVTLNRSEAIAPAKAQRRKHEIQGVNRTWFAGAYWGWGFHEDGMRSAVEVAAAFDVRWPAYKSTALRRTAGAAA